MRWFVTIGSRPVVYLVVALGFNWSLQFQLLFEWPTLALGQPRMGISSRGIYGVWR